MSEYELIDAIASLQGEGGRAFMDFITVLFAYVVVAHFVGAGLSRVTVSLLTIIYSAFAVADAAGVHNALSLLQGVQAKYSSELASLGFPRQVQTTDPYLPRVLIGLAWALSLAYMYQVRKKARKPLPSV
jgi:hypothetical protein